MRFVRLTVFPDRGLHPVGATLVEEGGGRRRAVLYMDTYPDETGVLLYRLEGTRSRLESALDTDHTVQHAEVFRAPNGGTDRLYCHVHVSSGSPACELIEVIRHHDLIVETPLEFRANGGIRVLLAGRQGDINRAFRSLQSIIDFEVIATGEYDPATRGLLAELTAKQRRVLRTAIELGYYDVPKQATHIDIATEVGCATSTVDEHLRKAESRVFQTILA